MKQYIGVKLIKAIPMNRLDYNLYRGWELPIDEDGSDEGMLVEYLDGGKSNHPNHNGYISWSPKEVFENAYKECENMTFGLAIEAMKLGYRVARTGWNGKGMHIHLHNFEYINDIADEGYTYEPCFVMYTAQNKWQPGWLASQNDMIAEDWGIVG